MVNIVRFFVFLLVSSQAGLRIFSAADDIPCKPSPCPTSPITVDAAGKITMTLWYDNDENGGGDNRNTDMVLKVCQAMDLFKDKFSVEFKIGAGTRVDPRGELECLHDCIEDRLEGCVAMKLDASKFNALVCSNNRGASVYDAAAKLGVTKEVLNMCLRNKRSDEYLLNNGDARREAGLSYCYLPEFALNNVITTCIKIPTFEELKKVLCEIYKRGRVSVPGC